MTTMTRSFGAFAQDIKFSHSIFALPFVGTGLLVAGIDSISWQQVGLILVCMISARSFAMGMNRLLDCKIDRQNARTANRAIPSGRLSPAACLFWSLGFATVFVLGAFQLSSLAGWLSLPLLAILATYSLMKRVSWITHWYLGACLGLAPIAAQIALLGYATAPVLLIGVAITFWTAGFDLLYSLQDRVFDEAKGLKSAPVTFGPRGTLLLSLLSFAIMIAILVAVGMQITVGAWYWCGVLSVAAVLAFEHWLVRDAWTNGTSKNITAAFFNANACVSVAFFAFVVIDWYWING